MIFNGRVEALAMDRQSKMDGYGSWCAMCGAGLWYFRQESVPRVPISNGGDKRAPNCVVVCHNCFPKIKNPGKEEIPWSVIPFYRIAPPDWYERSRQPLGKSS